MSNKYIFAVSSIVLGIFATGLASSWDNEQLRFLLALGTLVSSAFSFSSLVRIFKK